MNNLAAVRVIAFSRKNEAIHIHPDEWKVSLYGNKVVLKGGGSKIRYDLSADLLCIHITDRIEETAMGKTVKRAALTGIAAHMLSPGKGVGGVMMDLALRGSETRVIVHARMVMKDTTTLSFEATEEEYEEFVSDLPSNVRTQEALDQARKMISLADRMAVDGMRSLAEVDGKIASLQEKQVQARQRTSNDESFDERDAARLEEQGIGSEIEYQLQLKKAAMHRLSAPPVLKRRVSLSKMIAVAGSVIFCGALVLGAFNDGSQDKEIDSTPSAATSSPPSVQIQANMAKANSTPSPDQGKMSADKVVLAAPVSQPASSQEAQETSNATGSELGAKESEIQPSIKPSFDCSKASSRVEKMICSDPRLSSADEKLAETYRKAMAVSANRDALKADQIGWIRTERNVCSDATSLLDVYQAREKQLERMVAPQ